MGLQDPRPRHSQCPFNPEADGGEAQLAQRPLADESSRVVSGGLTLEELIKAAEVTTPALPVPLLARPAVPQSKSHRLWGRHRRKIQLWKSANDIIRSINALNSGSLKSKKTHRPSEPACVEVRDAWCRVHALALAEANRVEKGCRAETLTGGQAVAALLKTELASRYSFKDASSVTQVPLIAKDVDEPTTELFVPLLEVLPAEERDFYMEEANVADWGRGTPEVFSQLQVQYGFVGGSQHEYESQFARSLLARMCDFRPRSGAKAIVGSFVELKKRRTRRGLVSTALRVATFRPGSDGPYTLPSRECGVSGRAATGPTPCRRGSLAFQAG